MSASEVRETTCYMCTDDCPAQAHLEDGRVAKVGGRLCARGRAIPELVHHPDRLLHPLRRSGPRGSNRFDRVSWDQALREIAGRLLAIKREYGPQAVAFYSGYTKEARPWFQRLAHAFGSPNFLTESSICYSATRLANAVTFGGGHFLEGPSPETKLLVVWATNPARARYYTFADFLAARRRGLKVIVVDPRRTEMAAHADLHLRPRPGTDGALALSLIQVLVSEGLYDHEFVGKWTVGFEDLTSLVAAYPPEVGEGITGVPAGLIRQAARLWAEVRPARLQTSASGLVQSPNGVQNHRAVTLLSAITGNLDVPGGNCRRDPLPLKDITLFASTVEAGWAPRIGSDRFPLWCRLYPEAQANALPEQIETGKPYPVKALVGIGANYMIWPNSERYAEALRRLDLLVFGDFFPTPTTELGDYVLPAATSLERAALIVGPGDLVRYRQPALEPLGEAWPDWRFVFELARHLGLGEQFWGGDLEAGINEILSPAGLSVEDLKRSPEGLHLGQRAISSPDASPESATGAPPGFATPSGKVEIRSSLLERYGYDPLPVYREQEESPRSRPDLAREFPLVLMTGARVPMYTHSQHRNLPSLRRLMPEPVVDIHPADAAERGIAAGDRVAVSSPRGEIEVKAHLTDRMPPGVVNVFHGWREANVNLLVDDRQLDPISGFPPFKVQLCQVRRA